MVKELLRRSTQGAHGTPGTVTFGVVLFVPEPGAGVLARARLETGDPLGSLIPPHVTLLPPSTLLETQLPEVREHLTGVGQRHPPFPIRLQGTATFRPITPVVFTRLTDGAEGCAALEASVRTGVLHRELAFDYHPHITLAYGVDDVVLDLVAERMSGFDQHFWVREFHLVVFDQAARPRIEQTIPLLGL